MCNQNSARANKGDRNLIILQNKPKATISLEQMEERRLVEAIEIANAVRELMTSSFNRLYNKEQ